MIFFLSVMTTQCIEAFLSGAVLGIGLVCTGSKVGRRRR